MVSLESMLCGYLRVSPCSQGLIVPCRPLLVRAQNDWPLMARRVEESNKSQEIHVLTAIKTKLLLLTNGSGGLVFLDSN